MFKLRNTLPSHFKLTSHSRNLSEWQSVVGLEIHAQISSNTKLFSRSPTTFASSVNNNVSLFDCSIPGTLPVLNKRCVEAGILTALALNCKVNPISTFDRKHYFYADLPAGYQITQQRMPLACGGHLEFQVQSERKKINKVKCGLKQLQLEQDSGKSLHESDRSLVDLNRAGIPLIELVFEPDLKDGEEAAALVKELILILQRIKTCSCKMEDGALRVDANVSVNKKGDGFGTRTEIKNIGSIRGVAGAIKYEIERQIVLLKNGGIVMNETRAWDAGSKMTVPMRDKEEKQDYRYMPEPNLPPLFISMGGLSRGCFILEEFQGLIPELPGNTRIRLIENYGIPFEHAFILVNESKLLEMFERSVEMLEVKEMIEKKNKLVNSKIDKKEVKKSEVEKNEMKNKMDELKKEIKSNKNSNKVEAKLIINVLINDLLNIVNEENLHLDYLNLPCDKFIILIKMLSEGQINRSVLKSTLRELILLKGDDPKAIIEKNNWLQINDMKEIEKLCREIVEENPVLVGEYKKGKKKVFKAILGIVVKKSNQRANMSLVEKTLNKMLS